MEIAVIVPYEGKRKYQREYDAIIAAIESRGDSVLSPEKSQIYNQVLQDDLQLRDTPKSHYEFMRKSIIDSDAVIVEASWEDFRIGHETSLALLYQKPVLVLSQSLDLSVYIHHPGFYGVKYQAGEIAGLVTAFLEKVRPSPSLARGKAFDKNAKTSGVVAVFGGVYADILNRVPDIPGANEVVLSNDFKISLGGKATNAAVAMARMENSVVICGRIGHDLLGVDLEKALIHEGIKTDFLRRDHAIPTGTVTLAVDNRAKYSTIVHEAANVRITRESVDELFEKFDAGTLPLECVYLTLEMQSEMVEHIVCESSRRQIFTFCDAAPHTRPLDSTLLPLIDVVAPNELEVEAMTGIAVRDRETAQRAVELLAQHGAKEILLTLGNRGALYYHADEDESIFTEALSVSAIDEAGAGDAFRAAFVTDVLGGEGVRTALARASCAGAYAVTHFGSYDSMPTKRELLAFVS